MSDLLVGYDSDFFVNSNYSEEEVEIGELKQTVLCLKSATTDLDLTGQIIWPASRVLAWFLHQNQDLVKGAHVLELGAGCGLPGFLAAQLGAASVYLTDVNPVVLKLLEESTEVTGNKDIKQQIRVRRLEWGENETATKLVSEFKEKEEFPNLIIAADVFQTSFGSPSLLFQSIKLISQAQPDHRFGFYVCFALRQTTREELLKQCAEEEGFKLEKICIRQMLPEGHPPDSFTKEKLRFFHLTL